LVVALGVGQIKTGAPCRSERSFFFPSYVPPPSSSTLSTAVVWIGEAQCRLLFLVFLVLIQEYQRGKQILCLTHSYPPLISSPSSLSHEIKLKLTRTRKQRQNNNEISGVAKYNALIRIEDEIHQSGGKTIYAGAEGFSVGPKGSS
jgi:hypothetical protein